MRKTIKIVAALIAVATLCATPLFAAEDAEAVRVEEGNVGLSVSINSLSDTNMNKLFSTEQKNSMAYTALALTTDQENLTSVINRWTLSDLVMKDVKNLKESRGANATGSSYDRMTGSSFECTLSFTATSKIYYASTPYLFEFTDGTQDLYDFIGSNTAPVDSTLKVTGTLVKKSYSSSSGDYFKAKNREVCPEKTITEESNSVSFTGHVVYTFTQGGSKTVREYDVESNAGSESRFTSEMDYGKVDKGDVIGTTEVKMVGWYDKNLEVREFRFTTSEQVKGGYRSVMDLKSTFMPTGDYEVGEAKDYWQNEDQPLPEYHYYGGVEELCLFTSANDDSLKTDEGMESFLKGLSDTEVSDSYSTARSVAESAETTIDSPSSDSKMGILPYIIIGVLVIVIVLLLVLLLRKKKEPEQKDL